MTRVSFLQMDYIRTQSKPRDGKLLAIGHSMGGILLYAMLSLYGIQVFLLFAIVSAMLHSLVFRFLPPAPWFPNWGV